MAIWNNHRSGHHALEERRKVADAENANNDDNADYLMLILGLEIPILNIDAEYEDENMLPGIPGRFL